MIILSCSSRSNIEKLRAKRLTIFAAFCMFLMLPLNSLAQVEISEFMASNDGTLDDEDGDESDWIEIKNTSGGVIDLSNWYLTDDQDLLPLWQFPATTLIAADEYLIVFASEKERAIAGSELHTNFKLKGGGEYLAIVMPDGTTVVDDYAPEYPQQYDDISYGGNIYYDTPTPGSANSGGILGFAESVVFDVPHGVYDTTQTLALSSNLPAGEIRYTLDGSEPPTDLGCTPPANGMAWAYNYYEGAWTSLPDFDQITPTASGTADTISTDPRQRDEVFGLRFTGCIDAPTDGLYTFIADSDDQSRVYIDGQLVVSNDDAQQAASNEVSLSKGLHSVQVDFFQNTGGQQLAIDWIAPLRGDTYITTQNNGELFAAPIPDNVIDFDVDVPGNGLYQFRVRLQGLDGDSDSFWVQLNDQTPWLFRTGNTASFEDVLLNDDNNNISVQLTAGEHSLKFYPHEDGTRIDSLQIEAISCEGPCATQELQAEIESVSGTFTMAGLDQETLPGISWLTYSSPLQIDKTSIVRAVATQDQFIPSDVTTNSYFFLTDVVLQSRLEETPSGWPSVEATLNDMDYGMDPDIVDPDPSAVIAALASLPTISIVTDIDNLLHPDFGIYVNATSKGRYWERPASIELIDPSGAEAGFSIDAGIRVRGGFSRRADNPKHPFRIYFRGSYDGDLDYPLFGDEGVDEFERIDLRSPNNYSWAFSGGYRNTFLREVWSRDTQKALGNPYSRSRYYHQYINGQYWGVVMTQERISKEYAKSYFGGDKDDYDVVKHDRDNGYTFEANDGFNDSWNQIWDAVADQTISESEYAILKDTVDMDSLINYMLINGYEGDLDGATSWFLSRWLRANNWYAVRDRNPDGLKWSFLQHDGEHTMGARRNASAEENTLGPFAPFNGTSNAFFTNNYMNPYWLHEALLSHIDYRQQVIDTVDKLFSENGVLSNEQALARWLVRKNQVSPAILAHSARWGDSKLTTPRTVTDWETEVDFVENTFFADRAQIVIAQLEARGLTSSIESPELTLASGSTVENGDTVFTNNTSETIYYTLDGTDPRAPGGGISANAIALLPGESIILTESTQIILRILISGIWSPPTVAEYDVIERSILVSLNEIVVRNLNTYLFQLLHVRGERSVTINNIEFSGGSSNLFNFSNALNFPIVVAVDELLSIPFTASSLVDDAETNIVITLPSNEIQQMRVLIDIPTPCPTQAEQNQVLTESTTLEIGCYGN